MPEFAKSSITNTSRATSGYVGLNQLEKQKLEVAGSSGAVQASRMGNDAPVVGWMRPPLIPDHTELI